MTTKTVYILEFESGQRIVFDDIELARQELFKNWVRDCVDSDYEDLTKIFGAHSFWDKKILEENPRAWERITNFIYNIPNDLHTIFEENYVDNYGWIYEADYCTNK